MTFILTAAAIGGAVALVMWAGDLLDEWLDRGEDE